jgi:hypothetical protein
LRLLQQIICCNRLALLALTIQAWQLFPLEAIAIQPEQQILPYRFMPQRVVHTTVSIELLPQELTLKSQYQFGQRQEHTRISFFLIVPMVVLLCDLIFRLAQPTTILELATSAQRQHSFRTIGGDAKWS